MYSKPLTKIATAGDVSGIRWRGLRHFLALGTVLTSLFWAAQTVSGQTIDWVGRGVTGSTVGATISGTAPANVNWAGSLTPTTSQIGYIVIDNPAGIAGAGLTHTTAMNIGQIFMRNVAGSGNPSITFGGAAGASAYTLTSFIGWGQMTVRLNNISTLFGTITGDAVMGDGTSSFTTMFVAGSSGTLVVGGILTNSPAAIIRAAAQSTGQIKIRADAIYNASGASITIFSNNQAPPSMGANLRVNILTNAGFIENSTVTTATVPAHILLDGGFFNTNTGSIELTQIISSSSVHNFRGFTVTSSVGGVNTNAGRILVRGVVGGGGGGTATYFVSLNSGDYHNSGNLTLFGSSTQTTANATTVSFTVHSGNVTNTGFILFDNHSTNAVGRNFATFSFSGNLTNSGTVSSVNSTTGLAISRLLIGNAVHNEGTFAVNQAGTGVTTLTFEKSGGGLATFTNAASGRLLATSARATLDFSNTTLTNAGTIAATSGGVIVLGEIVSQTGTITASSATIEALQSFANLGYVGLTNGHLRMATGKLLTNNHLVSLGSTITGDVTNNGSITVTATSTITGAFANNAAGSLAVSGGNLHLTSATAPVNNGTIYVGAHQLNVTASSWTNSGYIQVQGGSIRTGNGAGLFSNINYISTGSSIDSHFANFGTFALTNHTSITGNFTNAGWTSPSGFDLSLRSNFSNQGDGITTGVLQSTGTVSFAPTSGNATFSNTVTNATGLGGNYNTSAMRFTPASGTINFEVLSTDMGSGAFTQLTNGFAWGTLTLPNTMTLLRLLDNMINQGGGTQEAIYVNNLHLGSALTASNFDFGGSNLKIYYNHIIGDGGVNFVGTYDGAERVVYFDNIIPMSIPPPSAVVPEPSTVALLALGLALVAWRIWRRRNSASDTA